MDSKHAASDSEVDSADVTARVTELEAALAEAREREAALAGVLEVISKAPANLQATLDEIVLKACRLLESRAAVVVRVTAGRSERVAIAVNGAVTEHSRLDARTAGPSDSDNQAALSNGRTMMNHGGPDAIQDAQPSLAAMWRTSSTASALVTPLVTAAGPFGTLVVSRESPEPYRADQISLFETFARQAVIAIENARLFRELQDSNHEVTEALEREQATGEILRQINAQPEQMAEILEAIGDAIRRTVGADATDWYLIEGDELFHGLGGYAQEPWRGRRSLDHAPLASEPWIANIVASRQPETYDYVDQLDMQSVIGEAAAIDAGFPNLRTMIVEQGARHGVRVPLVRDEKLTGVFVAIRGEGKPSTDAQVTLLESFTGQAAIAIDNARLLRELRERNREVTEALDQQTAMAEVLEVIATSPSDLGTVLEAILRSAIAVTAGSHGMITAGYGGSVHWKQCRPGQTLPWRRPAA
jgi:two-component system, NtrC family, sensor kinase